MEKNGSPAPVFDSDDGTYVLVTIPVHTAFNAPEIKDSIGADSKVNRLLFKDMEDLIAWTNGAINGVTNGAETIIQQAIHIKVKEMLIAADSWISREELFEKIGLTNQSFNRKKFLDPLLDIGWIEMKFPDNRTHPEQRYKISESGKRLLAIINK